MHLVKPDPTPPIDRDDRNRFKIFPTARIRALFRRSADKTRTKPNRFSPLRPAIAPPTRPVQQHITPLINLPDPPPNASANRTKRFCIVRPPTQSQDLASKNNLLIPIHYFQQKKRHE